MGFLTSLNPFISHPSFLKLRDLPHPEMMAQLRKPEVRKQILSEEPSIANPIAKMIMSNFPKMFPIIELTRDPNTRRNSRLPARCIGSP